MSRPQIVLIGGGGHAKVVLEAIRSIGLYDIIGITDPDTSDKEVLGVPVLGDDDRLPSIRAKGVQRAALVVGDNRLRQTLGDRIRALGFSLPAIVHPNAFVAPSASIGEGAVIMARAVIGTCTRVDALAIINTGAIVDHDNMIGVAAHVAPGCALAGCVQVGARALVGAGSAIIPHITIGEDAVVGAGSAVIADVATGARVGGVPARALPHSARNR